MLSYSLSPKGSLSQPTEVKLALQLKYSLSQLLALLISFFGLTPLFWGNQATGDNKGITLLLVSISVSWRAREWSLNFFHLFSDTNWSNQQAGMDAGKQQRYYLHSPLFVLAAMKRGQKAIDENIVDCMSLNWLCHCFRFSFNLCGLFRWSLGMSPRISVTFLSHFIPPSKVSLPPPFEPHNNPLR